MTGKGKLFGVGCTLAALFPLATLAVAVWVTYNGYWRHPAASGAIDNVMGALAVASVVGVLLMLVDLIRLGRRP